MAVIQSNGAPTIKEVAAQLFFTDGAPDPDILVMPGTE